MTCKQVVEWHCDRCDRKLEGSSTYPRMWLRVEGPRDLCFECARDYGAWWAAGKMLPAPPDGGTL